MVFKLRLRVLACTLMLAALSAFATVLHDSPRGLVLCALAAAIIVAFLHYTLKGLERAVPIEETSVRQPDQQMQFDALLTAETRLEHVPIALFGIDETSYGVTPLNAYARKLSAPGRASDLADLHKKIVDLKVGQRQMISFDTDSGQERALVVANAITIQGKPQRLIALLTIESELETAALAAWQQLAHVLTHEIMNSLTPVASLSQTALELLNDIRPSVPATDIADLSTALDAISRRSQSLTHFVSSYRTLTNVPVPMPEPVNISALFERLSALVSPSWIERGGQANFTVESTTLDLLIDGGQLEQALLNLIQNAVEATASIRNPELNISARLGRGGRLRIEVRDNGPGVPEALIPHIFTPFFTSKPKGSGIGLAMVKQLIHRNGGTVRYVKSTDAGASFVVIF